MRRDQNRNRLEKHLEHRGNVGHSYPAPHSHFRDRGLTQGERLHISQVKAATRAALGPSFDFNKDDDRYGRSNRHADTYQRSRGWIDDREYKVNDIPQNYIDEFNQKWHEYDEDNDADQLVADYAKEAKWRKHEPIHYSIPDLKYASYEVPSSKKKPRAMASPMKRTDSGYASMASIPGRHSPECKEVSYRSQRSKTSHRPKTSKRAENSYRSEQSRRPYTSYRAEQARRQEGHERPRTPIPGLVSTFSWDTQEPAKKRRGGFFGGLFRRH